MGSSSSSSFDPLRAMPFAPGPAWDTKDHSPESKRRRAVGDIDFGGDAEIDEADAAMDVLLSLGFNSQAARRTISE
eukprot:11969126-Heterocapsa_arctica.AAC.1